MLKNIFIHVLEDFTITTNISANNVSEVFCYFSNDPYDIAAVTLSSNNVNEISLTSNTTVTTAEVKYKIDIDDWSAYKPINYRIDWSSTDNKQTTAQYGIIYLNPSVIPVN